MQLTELPDVSAQVPPVSLLPLFVDLDGTLTPSDTLVESIIQLVKRTPMVALQLPFWMLRRRLPIRQDLLAYLREEKKKGRTIILATAAHRSIATAVATELKIFDDVIASDATCNLKGCAKLSAIQSIADGPFVYAGDSKADKPIWREAEAAILVGVSKKLARVVHRTTPVECEFANPAASVAVWFRALRVHQWAKNLLIFVPLLTGFAFLDPIKLVTTFGAFIAFSLAASATYIVNDLWDLDSDRVHPRKRYRPFASATLGIKQGIGMAGLLLTLAALLAGMVSAGFLLMLALYVVLTTAYSLWLKEYVLIDVLMLSMLYTLRILSGSVAVQIPASSWLLAFSVFLFFSLALIKRCSELVSLDQSGGQAARGRDYRVSDLTVLWPLGCAASLSAVVVFGLFISSAETQERYASGQLLWLVAFALMYWIGRMWVKTSRGEMHDDPIVFALKDFGSCMTILAMFIITLVAHFFHLTVGGVIG
jgi:4-hydroxybenzoate polyprenyltransferase